VEFPVVGGKSVWISGLDKIKAGIQTNKLNPEINQEKIRLNHILPLKNDQFQILRVII
jgi:hypothetical protein